MKEEGVKTGLGEVSLTIDSIEGTDSKPPIIFMHGVFLDKTLWKGFESGLTGRTHIYIEMPAHGNSCNVGKDWSLDNCVEMLIQILDELDIDCCIAIGHSWGSMTILRAAHRFPSRFAALGLFNMPFRRTSGMSRLGFTLQKYLVYFPRFYGGQAAKSLYIKEFLQNRPELKTNMQERLEVRPPKELSRVIDAVILQPTDAMDLINDLNVPALAVVGESDYVGKPPGIETIIVPGGHISPHEAPSETRQAIKQLLEIAGNSKIA